MCNSLHTTRNGVYPPLVEATMILLFLMTLQDDKGVAQAILD